MGIPKGVLRPREEEWPAGDKWPHCLALVAAPCRPRLKGHQLLRSGCPSVKVLSGEALHPSGLTYSYPRAKGSQTTVQQASSLWMHQPLCGVRDASLWWRGHHVGPSEVRDLGSALTSWDGHSKLYQLGGSKQQRCLPSQF